MTQDEGQYTTDPATAPGFFVDKPVDNSTYQRVIAHISKNPYISMTYDNFPDLSTCNRSYFDV